MSVEQEDADAETWVDGVLERHRQAAMFADKWDLEGACTDSGPLIDELRTLLDDVYEAGFFAGRQTRSKP